ncbi:MAG: copper resistance protein NlpE [Bacteroides sp.]|nr:copper resistance protein NlpE [Bacteroides sp.]MBD5291286.1 copper resistance protein NlpE [Bacteroides sp.]MDE6230716.1 copper resistance protein NlpE [Muribaculaceae bacterium]
MKKTVYVAAAALAVLTLSACGNKTCNNGKCGRQGDRKELYTGVLPAADTDGIRYTLSLDYDDDHNFTDGDYDLIETYIASDSTSFTGYRDLKSFKSEGDFTVSDNAGKKVLRLVQDVRDSQPGSTSTPIYFLVDSDSTLVMVNADLELPTRPGDYTLRLAK